MDDKTKAALVGFNFGVMGYMLFAWLVLGAGNATWGGFVMHVLIGIVTGAVLGGIAFFVGGK